MRNIFIALFIAFGALFSAQNMSKKDFVQKVNKLNLVTDYQELSVLERDFVNYYKRDKRKPWQAYYYAGLSCVCKARVLLENGEPDAVFEQLALASKYLEVVDAKSKNNPEVKALLGITSILGSEFNEIKKVKLKRKALGYFQMANKIAPNNQRVVLLGDLLNAGQKESKGTKSDLSLSWDSELLGDLINKN